MSNVPQRLANMSPLKLALATQQIASKLELLKAEPIAIIGLSCRFPGGADSPEAFWQLLHNGLDAITEVPKDRWNIEAYYDPNPDAPGKMYSRYGGFLAQVDTFEPQFFGVSPREACSLDPQQRLLLEVSWEALERANQVPERLFNSSTGVFVGICTNDYTRVIRDAGGLASIDAYFGTGNALSVAAGRLSYTLGLTGPSLAVDTACSSSLVAVHLACQSLRHRECDLALAGGVNLILSADLNINFCKARMISSDGRCKTFDATADGYVRGEGCGVIVLKRLSDAVANGDNILALVRGSAVNQDGPSGGLTVPNGPSQEALIHQALNNGGVEPQQVSYIEAHGTGTSLGDPIEVEALGGVFGKNHSQDRPLMIGSVKTNFGHLEGAAGIAGLIKVVLALQHQQLPPHLHFKQPNPYINWDRLPVRVITERTPWPRGETRRIAGVSSFGFSGTNAHVLIEEASVSEPVQGTVERLRHLLTLSAKTEEALKQLAKRYEDYLGANPALALGDICFSANTGRSHFSHRLSVVADSTVELGEKLASFTTGQEAPGVFGAQLKGTNQPKIAFLFTGQGSQYADMGRQLYETQPTFRQTLDRCNEILRPYLDKPLLEVLYPKQKSELRSQKSEVRSQNEALSPDSLIDETAYTQPALFALEYALFRLWESWGIKPDAVMGHSVGEYAAACVAGIFSLSDGLKLIATRARLMQALPQDGEMVAVFASVARVASAIQPYAQKVAIAAINGPKSIVISGERQAVEAVTNALHAEGIATKKLQVSHAFHSPLMEPMLEEFEQVAKDITYSSPRITLISNVTGQPITAEIATPEYWCDHVRQPVRFAPSMEALYQRGYKVFVEIGPKPTLVGMGRHCLPEGEGVWLPSLRPGQADWQQLLESLGALYVNAAAVDWNGFESDYPRRRVTLPTYPFQRQRYWMETSNNGHAKAETLSLENVETPIVNLLHQGDTQQLAQYIETAAQFSLEEVKLLPKLLEVLVQQHQQHKQAAAIKDWLYQVEWQPQPRQVKQISFDSPGSWLILADKGGVGQALAHLLQEHGQNCLIVYAGDAYQAKEPGTWSLNPSNSADFDRLFQELVATSSLPLSGVIHLWSLDAELASELTIPSLEQIQVFGCGSTLHLVQTLVKGQGRRAWATGVGDGRGDKGDGRGEELPPICPLSPEGAPSSPSPYLPIAPNPHCVGAPSSPSPRLWLVTRGAVPVGTSLPGVAQASLWGLGKVIALEHPELWGGVLDLAPDAPTDEAVNLLAEIVDAQEDQLAWRSGQRYVARLVRSTVPTARAVILQSDSTYLITGGLGALGLKVAQWMVEQGVRHLVLTGRREASASVHEAIAQMQQAGVQVLVASADVANHQDMVRTLEQVHSSMPPLLGIVHAAGVLDDGILLQQDWGRFAKVMAAKVLGTWNLHVLTESMPLDFLVTFSSVAALLGSPGQGNYAAANAFMDAVAHYRSRSGLPGLSINWGPWSDSGMAASLGSRDRERFAAQGIESIPLEQGLSVLKQLLGQSTSQVGVLPIEWSVFRQQLGAVRQLPLLSELLGSLKPPEEAQQPSAIGHELLQRLEAALPGDRHSLLINHIQSEVANVLKLDSSQLPDPQQGFFDMGMDSLMAVELKNRLDASLGCSLPTTLAFESPTIKDLAEYLATEVLRWESPTTGDAELTQGGDEALSEVEQLPEELSEDEVEASIAEKLSKLESLLKNN